ncbi:glutamate--tRNA ligase 2 [Aliidongia dinghuensis]|uniref:Glutamate--tRNA ligase n=1 Tax=Aliidongia dinghuensis TaxID=1867774 RepID=A0A8J3E632_9PROT|nr:glutamate--tRNA ligase [Aliidongia dinghuensis]GGF40322.1 glutamate--tRNA ligase 2 [Aliidongia dinghuensis]
MTVIARFAPSPTGYLHIGGARTALFNWLFARHHGGKCLLRIEDTDRVRSTEAAIKAIIDGLAWLGLDFDGDIVMQFKRAPRHAEVAHAMLAAGTAYYCYCTPEELEAMREKARAEGRPVRYDGTWRDRDPSEAPPGVKPVIRLRAPQTGSTVIRDGVQGEVTVDNEQLDDLVLLRADGTPTYMLSVVVDDHDMGITHVIRGDDHLTNAFRQAQIYRANNWSVPEFSHIPLIHGPDGAKLSKRHGALGIEAYREMGYLPEALRNYLLRLGWGHGDDEIIPTEQAISWFDLPGIGRAPARLDYAKLDNLNGHYMRQADDGRLVDLVAERIGPFNQAQRAILLAAMAGLKARAKTLVELADNARFYVAARPIPMDEKAAALGTEEARARLGRLAGRLKDQAEWTETALEAAIRAFVEAEGVKLGAVAQPLRAALAGAVTSPGIFEVMAVLGRDEALGRIGDFAGVALD